MNISDQNCLREQISTLAKSLFDRGLTMGSSGNISVRLDDDCIPPLTAYYVMRVGKLPLVPYHVPGDPKLGDAVRGLAGKHSAVLLANHGPVVAGKNLEAAVYATEELEETAKLYLLLRGENPHTLTDAQVSELEARFPRN